METKMFMSRPEYITAVKIKEDNLDLLNVKTHKGCGYRMCPVCGGSLPTEVSRYIELPDRYLYVKIGDWLVLDKDFTKTISESDLYRLYTEVK